jgi:hypothetical protein
MINVRRVMAPPYQAMPRAARALSPPPLPGGFAKVTAVGAPEGLRAGKSAQGGHLFHRQAAGSQQLPRVAEAQATQKVRRIFPIARQEGS